MSEPGLAVSNFKFVSLDQFCQINKLKKGDQLIKRIAAAARRRNSIPPAACSVCGNVPIWTVGSALAGFDMCFTCVTGESDASNDYEVSA